MCKKDAVWKGPPAAPPAPTEGVTDDPMLPERVGARLDELGLVASLYSPILKEDWFRRRVEELKRMAACPLPDRAQGSERGFLGPIDEANVMRICGDCEASYRDGDGHECAASQPRAQGLAELVEKWRTEAEVWGKAYLKSGMESQRLISRMYTERADELAALLSSRAAGEGKK